jgi:DNA-binding CsgD family transcriptional regulator
VWLSTRLEELARRARISLSPPPGPEESWAEASADDRDGVSPTVDAAHRSLPAARPAARLHTLSDREVEVLRLVAAGRSNGEIGDALFITRKTAGVHVTHILDKLGVSNRVEAAMAAARLGLLAPPDEPATRENGR